MIQVELRQRALRREPTLGDEYFVSRPSNLNSLMSAQRHALTRPLIWQAPRGRARAIGESLVRLARGLSGLFGRSEGLFGAASDRAALAIMIIGPAFAAAEDCRHGMCTCKDS
jgi:hypothetical protein